MIRDKKAGTNYQKFSKKFKLNYHLQAKLKVCIDLIASSFAFR